MFNIFCRLQAMLFLFLAAGLTPLAVLAAETGDPAPEQFQQMPSMAGYFFRVAISLTIILVLTYLVIRVIKKQQEIQQRGERAGREWIRVFDYYSLGVNRGIYLAQVLGGVYVIAVSDHYIGILKEINPEDDSWHSIRESLETTGEFIPAGLRQKVTSYLKKIRGKDFKAELEESLNGEISDQLNRTRRLHRQYTGGGGKDE